METMVDKLALEVTEREKDFPFLPQAKRTIDAVDVSVPEIADDEQVTARAEQRIVQAIEQGQVEAYIHGYGDPGDPDTIELLSYPIARAIISSIGTKQLIDRFAKAEAKRCLDTAQDNDDYSLTALANDCGVTIQHDSETNKYTIPVGAYTAHTPAENGWSLAKQDVRDGIVHITPEQFQEMVVWLFEDEIADGLPFDVPAVIQDKLEENITTVKDTIGEKVLPNVDTFDPSALPPCLARAYTAAQEGDPSREQLFALSCFINYVGGDRQCISSLEGIENDLPAVQMIDASFKSTFQPQSHATLRNMGVCDGTDCVDTHPVIIYAENLQDAESFTGGQNSQQG